MQISILCKVVDNFGDIGVVYRLAKQLKKINPKNTINLIVDNLESFNKICSAVQCGLEMQEVEGLVVYDWNAADFCHNAFSRNDGEPMPVILECFQCGRPDWMERILFEEKLQRTVHIIMIDYLTAEKYAEDFHCLKSLTRSAKVQKVNFMPGFTEKTGGLVIDADWQKVPEWKENDPVLVFTYERDWTSFIQGWLSAASRWGDLPEPSYKSKLLLAQGRGKESFLAAVRNVVESSQRECIENSFIEELPYLNQSEWDRVMKSCSALVIRGEESMSRACLSGIPFIWHAYPQSDEYQLVKVKALLERMKPHFDEADFEIVEKVWLEINSSDECIASRGAEQLSNSYYDFFASVPRLVSGFQDFARSLRKNGDLAYNLMTYIEKLDII